MSLDGGGVTPLQVVTESGNLADSQGDVRTSVGGEVEQQADYGAIAPSFFQGR